MIKDKNKGGRNTKMTPGLVEKLKEYFTEGLSDREACLLVGIDKQTLYNYCNENKEFFDQKEALKMNPVIKAKRAINKEIDNGDISTCKWYLERKAKEEFSLKESIINNNTQINNLAQESNDSLSQKLLDAININKPKEL